MKLSAEELLELYKEARQQVDEKYPRDGLVTVREIPTFNIVRWMEAHWFKWSLQQNLLDDDWEDEMDQSYGDRWP